MLDFDLAALNDVETKRLKEKTFIFDLLCLN